MLPPVRVVILLGQLTLHLGQLPLQLLDFGAVRLGADLLLQRFLSSPQPLDFPVNLIGIAGAALRFVPCGLPGRGGSVRRPIVRPLRIVEINFDRSVLVLTQPLAA